MSVAGTALTVVLSLPLALLAAPNTTPHPAIGRLLRIMLAACRSVPEIILGIIFVAAVGFGALPGVLALRSEEHTSELQSLMRFSYAVFCLKTKIYKRRI